MRNKLEALLETQPHLGDSLPPQAPLPLMPGQIVDDKYEVERILGVGGMGVVVSAMHLELGERVAIKAMLREVAASRDTATRFSREAKAVARMKCEFVAHVLDVGKLPDGTPFMVMEHLEGETLAACLDREGELPVEVAVDTLLEACVAIAEAHRLGIVHRDVKPANLFLSRDAEGSEVVKVLDFGISKSDENIGITCTSGPMGTPGYMSPEQLRSASSVRATADIWSLGVVLFEMLTGELPYEVTSFADFCANVLVSPPLAPRVLDPSIPEALEDVILRCLRRDPAERYANVLELARALAPFASDGGRALVARIELIGAPPSDPGQLAAPRAPARRTSSLPRSTPATLTSMRGRSAAASQVPDLDDKASEDTSTTPVAWPSGSTESSAGLEVPSRRRSRGVVIAGAVLVAIASLVAGSVLVARAPTSIGEVAVAAERAEAKALAARETSSDVAPVKIGPPHAPETVVTAEPKTPPAVQATPRGTTRAVPPPGLRGRLPTASPAPSASAPRRFEDFGGRK
jgi:serine/threonine protein kinase